MTLLTVESSRWALSSPNEIHNTMCEEHNDAKCKGNAAQGKSCACVPDECYMWASKMHEQGVILEDVDARRKNDY